MVSFSHLQAQAVKAVTIIFLVILAIPVNIINYYTDTMRNSAKVLKAFLILTIILTGELPTMTQSIKTQPTDIQLALKDLPLKNF